MQTHYEFTEGELLIIHNCLNEVLNGFPVSDFEGALGVSQGYATSLMRRLDSGGNTFVLTAADRGALARSIGLVVKELGEGEFSTRVGAEVTDAERLAGEIAG